MVATTTLDVSQYARLWRGVWWAQHLAMLLALVVGGLLLGALVTYLAGGLEAVANAEIERVWRQENINDAKREEELMNTAVFYWMARSVLRYP
jgi:Na+/H+-translocating membrane pyrophosphatase